jgi:signal peptidase I
MRKPVKPFWRQTIEWLIAIVAATCSIWAVYAFVGETYRVRISNQSGAYSEGTILWVDKWETGARASFSPFHFPFNYFGTGKGSRTYNRRKSLELSRYDLVVFNHLHPDTLAPDVRLRMLNRIIGLPGDTIRLYNGKLYINGVAVDPSLHTIVHFEAQLSDSTDLKVLESEYNLNDASWTQNLTFQFSAHPADALKLAGDSLVVHFSRLVEVMPDPRIFTTGIEKQNGDNFGPFVVPWKGMPAEPDSISPFAERVWNNFEIQGFNEPFFVDDSIPAFANDYYFLLSDYRNMGNDSRYFGPIPEYLIIGKVTRALWTPTDQDL